MQDGWKAKPTWISGVWGLMGFGLQGRCAEEVSDMEFKTNVDFQGMRVNGFWTSDTRCQ